MRLILSALFVSLCAAGAAQTSSMHGTARLFVGPQVEDAGSPTTVDADLSPGGFARFWLPVAEAADSQATPPSSKAPAPGVPVDKNGNPIPLERRQPQRILGFMPNFRTVSGGAAAHPPGFKYNFVVATHQAFDYSSFIFLGLTSLTAEGTNEHPALGKGIEGFGQYTWRGFLDKTDNTYLSAFLLSTLLREDTRYYALGTGHNIPVRVLYVIGQQGVSRTWSGHKTPNFAGLGAKALTQFVSRYYYPSSATDFGTLATKFGYSVMRDVAFSSVREFFPDINAHYIRKHEAKEAHLAARRAAQISAPSGSPAAPAK